MLLQIAGQRAQPQTVTATELTSSHATRPIQTCQPLYLRAATTTNHRSRLSAHKQSPSQIFRSQQVRSSDAYDRFPFFYFIFELIPCKKNKTVPPSTPHPPPYLLT